MRGLETALIPLGPAEGEIGTHLGQPNAPDQLARRVENQHPGMTQWSIRAAPQITEDVGAHVVRPAFDAVYRHVGEQTLVGELCALQVEGIDDTLGFAGAVFVCTSWWRALVRWRTTDFSSRHLESNRPLGTSVKIQHLVCLSAGRISVEDFRKLSS